jgi:hypothetical protein
MASETSNIRTATPDDYKTVKGLFAGVIRRINEAHSGLPEDVKTTLNECRTLWNGTRQDVGMLFIQCGNMPVIDAWVRAQKDDVLAAFWREYRTQTARLFTIERAAIDGDDEDIPRIDNLDQ